MAHEAAAMSIVEWLEAEREQSVIACSSVGLTPSVEIRRTVVTELEETKAHYSYEMQTVSPVAIPDFGWRIDRVPRHDGPASALAHELYERFGDECHRFSLLPEPVFTEDPEMWIRRHLLEPIRTSYLSELSSLEAPLPDVARKLSEGMLQAILGHETTRVDLLPVAGLRLEGGSMAIDDVVIRPLSSEELGDLSDAFHDLFRPWSTRLPRELQMFRPERVAIEIRSRFPKIDVPDAGHRLPRFVIALELLGFEPYGSGRAAYWTEPPPDSLTGTTSVRLPTKGETKSVSASDLALALSLAQAIPDGAVYGPRSRMDLAIHRFHLGAADPNLADRLVDFVIALEAFLLPPSFEGELGFKFALYGARYLARDSADRMQVFSDLQHVYRMRSKVVHGASPPDQQELLTAAATARRLAGRMFARALRDGWPAPEDFKTGAIMA